MSIPYALRKVNNSTSVKFICRAGPRLPGRPAAQLAFVSGPERAANFFLQKRRNPGLKRSHSMVYIFFAKNVSSVM